MRADELRQAVLHFHQCPEEPGHAEQPPVGLVGRALQHRFGVVEHGLNPHIISGRQFLVAALLLVYYPFVQPHQQVLDEAGGVQPGARYVVFHTFDGWYESIDLFEVAHPQTILAWRLNGEDLPIGNGAPLRLRVERQCGYKNVKFLRSLEVVDSLAGFGQGAGGISADYGFHWFAGV